MNDAHFWAVIALLALCALGFFVIAFARAQLPVANAQKVWTQLDERYDARVSDALAKYKTIVGQRSPGVGTQQQAQSGGHPEIDRVLSQNIPGYRPQPVSVVAEQPAAEEGVEIAE